MPLYIRMRRIEEKQQDVAYEYWVEDMILSRLRAMVYDSLQAGNPRVTDIETMYNMLTDAYLRRLAPDLRAVGE